MDEDLKLDRVARARFVEADGSIAAWAELSEPERALRRGITATHLKGIGLPVGEAYDALSVAQRG